MTTIDSALATLGRRSSLPATARVLLSLLEQLDIGALALTTPDGSTRRFGGANATTAGDADITLRDWRVCREVLTGGDVAFAQAYMDGRWDTSDLVPLLTVMARNQRALELAFYGRGWRRLAFRLVHHLRGNSRRQARRNIVAHYDLGNDFYRLWLDRSMTYSSALFEGDATRSLDCAQDAKYARLVQQLSLSPASRVLEIGCGWGGFAMRAARAGHRVTAISLSDAQTSFARDHAKSCDIADRVEFRIQDYRDVDERFDAVASIEMFEAVGERYWPAYFSAVRHALDAGGRACIQTITIADDRFDQYRRSSDFIQQCIFPGGMLPSPSRFCDEARRAGFDIADVFRFGHDYARTLQRWLTAFDANVDAIHAQGFDLGFIRCWRFYLAYCAAAFASETTDVAQYTLIAR